MCFGLAIKFPGADGQLAHSRAPDSRTDASRFFVCFAPLCFYFRKKTAKPGGTSSRPSFGSSLASALRSAGDALCSWGPRRACRLPPAARPRSSGRREREDKGRTGLPALLARLRSRRAPGTSCGVQPARLAACNRHVFRRATGTSSGMQPARLPARNRCILRRPLSASRGAQPARLCGVHSALFGAHRRAQVRAKYLHSEPVGFRLWFLRQPRLSNFSCSTPSYQP